MGDKVGLYIVGRYEDLSETHQTLPEVQRTQKLTGAISKATIHSGLYHAWPRLDFKQMQVLFGNISFYCGRGVQMLFGNTKIIAPEFERYFPQHFLCVLLGQFRIFMHIYTGKA